MKEAAFNTLHDGLIREITQLPSNEINMIIECDYLRERIQPVGEYFLIRLKNCKKFLFKKLDSDAATSIDLGEIASLEMEILNADEKNEDIVVSCTLGELHLNFDSLSVWVNELNQISQEQLENVAEEYWTEWESKIPND